MTRNEFSSIVFAQELEEKLFLVRRTSPLDRAPRFMVSWFMATVCAVPPAGSSTEGRRVFFFSNPEASSSFPAPFILVGCNFM